MAEPDAYGRPGKLVDVVAAQLYVVEVGAADGYPVIVLHGGPGLDHHEFADYLDPLADRGYRLILVDQRASGRSPRCDPRTWTLETMAEDVVSLARSMPLDRYAVLGHSYGAFVALQNAVDFPNMASQTIVSSGVPSAKYLADVEKNLERFEPEPLREPRGPPDRRVRPQGRRQRAVTGGTAAVRVQRLRRDRGGGPPR